MTKDTLIATAAVLMLALTLNYAASMSGPQFDSHLETAILSLPIGVGLDAQPE